MPIYIIKVNTNYLMHGDQLFPAAALKKGKRVSHKHVNIHIQGITQ